MNENLKVIYDLEPLADEEPVTLRIPPALSSSKYNDGLPDNSIDESMAFSGWLKRLESNATGKLYLKLIRDGVELNAEQKADARRIMGLPASDIISEMLMRVVTDETDRHLDFSGKKYPFPSDYAKLVLRDIEKGDLTMVEKARQVALQEFPEDEDGAALVMAEYFENHQVKPMSNRQKAALVGKRQFPLHHLGAALASLEYLEQLNLAKMTDEQRARLVVLREFSFRDDLVEMAVDVAMGRLRDEARDHAEKKLNVFRTYKNAGPKLQNLAMNAALGVLSADEIPLMEEQNLRYKITGLFAEIKNEFTGRGKDLAEREILDQSLSLEEKKLCEKRHLVSESLLKPLTYQEKRDLKSYRNLKDHPKFAHLSFLIFSREDATISKFHAAELAAYEEFYGADEEEYVELAKREILANAPRRRGVRELALSPDEKLKLAQYRAQKELPGEVQGQRLYVQKQIGELTKVQEAELGAREEFPGRPHIMKLAKNERLGRLKSKRHKMRLQAHRELIHDEFGAELLAKKELGEISKEENQDLKQRREKQYKMLDGGAISPSSEKKSPRKVTLEEAEIMAEMEFGHYKPAAKLVILELMGKIKPKESAELQAFRKFFAYAKVAPVEYPRILHAVDLYTKKLLHDASVARRAEEPAGQKSPLYKISIQQLAEVQGLEEFPEVFQQEAATLSFQEAMVKHGGASLSQEQKNLLRAWRKFPLAKEAAHLYARYLHLGIKMPAQDLAKMMAFLEFPNVENPKDLRAHQLVVKEGMVQSTGQKLEDDEQEFLNARREYVYYMNGLTLMAKESRGEPLTEGERMAHAGFINNPVNTIRAELIVLEARGLLKPDQAAFLLGLREFGDDIVAAKLAAREAMGFLKTPAEHRLIQAFRIFKNEPTICQLLRERASGKITFERLAKLNALRKFPLPLYATAAAIAEKVNLCQATGRDFRYFHLYEKYVSLHDDRMVAKLDAAYLGDLDAELSLDLRLEVGSHPVLLEIIQKQEKDGQNENDDVHAAIRRKLYRHRIESLEGDYEKNRAEILRLRARIEFPLDPIPAKLAEAELLAENGEDDLPADHQVVLSEYRRFARAAEVVGRRPIQLLNMEVGGDEKMTGDLRIELQANREFVEYPIAVKLVMQEQKCFEEKKIFDVRKAKVLNEYRMFIHNPDAVAALNKEQAFRLAFDECKILPPFTAQDRATLAGFRAFPFDAIAAKLERDFILGTLEDGQDLIFLAEYRRNKNSRHVMNLLNEKYRFVKFGTPMDPRFAAQINALLNAPSAPLPLLSQFPAGSIDVEFDH